MATKRYKAVLFDLGGTLVDVSADYKVFTPFPDVIPTLQQLKSRGYHLAVVSNAAGFDDEGKNKMGLLGVIDTWIFSGDVGIEKPDPTIFLHALEKIGVTAAEALMVGDSLSSDVRGAEAVGIDALLIDRQEVAPAYPQRMESFTELCEKLV